MSSRLVRFQIPPKLFRTNNSLIAQIVRRCVPNCWTRDGIKASVQFRLYWKTTLIQGLPQYNVMDFWPCVLVTGAFFENFKRLYRPKYKWLELQSYIQINRLRRGEVIASELSIASRCSSSIWFECRWFQRPFWSDTQRETESRHNFCDNSCRLQTRKKQRLR